MTGAIVLMYHRVCEQSVRTRCYFDRGTAVEPGIFAAQIEWLTARFYVPIAGNLDEADTLAWVDHCDNNPLSGYVAALQASRSTQSDHVTHDRRKLTLGAPAKRGSGNSSRRAASSSNNKCYQSWIRLRPIMGDMIRLG